MSISSRRDVILSAAAAGAALGLDKALAVTPALPKKAQTPDPKPGFHRYRVGDAEVIALYDGIWEKAHDPKYFGNASTDDIKKALADAGQTTKFVPIPITTFLVRLKGKLTLCDVGGGDQIQAFNPASVFVSGKMMANMKAAGVKPGDIETILISHFHPDHIFGLLEKVTNAPVFPNAEIILSSSEYKFWTDPSLMNRIPEARRPVTKRIQSVIPNWKNVLPVSGEDEVVPGIRFVKAYGHTAGHTAFHLSSGNEQLMISGDLAYLPAFSMGHPDWHGAFDQDAATAQASRHRVLDRVVVDNMLICGSHFPWPGLNRIGKDGGAGYALSPLSV
jgi:glyoxylase-like metal-dependent hydrolase (beta-lactamase superfamily II)